MDFDDLVKTLDFDDLVKTLVGVAVIIIVTYLAISFVSNSLESHNTMTVNECPIIDPVAQQILACSEISSGYQNVCINKVMENTTTHIE